MLEPHPRVRPRTAAVPAPGRPVGRTTGGGPAARRSGPALLGPAFVAAVAYIDPGNFATNITAGAHYGYALVWVIVAANLVAMLVQYLSAKLGLATGEDLPELCRRHFPASVVRGLWVQAELVAMATDLAEFVGAAVGLYLLFGVPLPFAGAITAVVAFGVLALDRRGHGRFEQAITALFGIVFLGFAYDLVRLGLDPGALLAGTRPEFAGGDSAVLAAGIIGATVMPHVVYLHSALTKSRAQAAPWRALLRSQRRGVLVALGTAGVVNIAMLVLAAVLLHGHGLGDADPILAAHAGLGRAVGGAAALAFAVALLASGLSSSSVGTYAGQVVMSGFLRRGIPLVLRRGLTMLPALVVLALGVPATDSLVFSQVVLSFGIPFALVPLVLLTGRADVMGEFVNRRVTAVTAVCCVAVISVFNLYLATKSLVGA